MAIGNGDLSKKEKFLQQECDEGQREVVLEAEHVAKDFRLPTEQASGLKQAVINWTRGIKGYKVQHVLRDINFKVYKGDFFGIVGRNGSGKSTLLKLISKIYQPSAGRITVKGKLVPFIELGVGFNPELTGRENVYLNGALLGFTHSEIDAMYDEIVDFAELNDFMDQKLKNYSSGMQVRLAFSVAIKAQGDILVLDEVLAVGDEAFQRKCNDFFEKIKQDPNKTVILVTHDMNAVKRYCNRAILIKDGDIIVSGNKEDVADRYTVENMKASAASHQEETAPKEEYPTGLSQEVPMLTVRSVGEPVCHSGSSFRFEIEYNHSIDRPVYANITLLDVIRGGVVFGQRFNLKRNGHQIVQFSMPTQLFNNGQYRIMASLHVANSEYDTSRDEMIAFTTEGNSCYFITRGEYGADNYALINNAVMDCVSCDYTLAEPKTVLSN